MSIEFLYQLFLPAKRVIVMEHRTLCSYRWTVIFSSAACFSLHDLFESTRPKKSITQISQGHTQMFCVHTLSGQHYDTSHMLFMWSNLKSVAHGRSDLNANIGIREDSRTLNYTITSTGDLHHSHIQYWPWWQINSVRLMGISLTTLILHLMPCRITH